MTGGTEAWMTSCCAVQALNPNLQRKTYKMTTQRLCSIAELESVPGTDDVLWKIPDELLASLDWRAGDVLTLSVRSGGLVMTNRSKLERDGREKSGDVPDRLPAGFQTPGGAPQCAQAVDDALVRRYRVMATWDSEAGVWVASSDEVPGLVTEASTVEALEVKLATMVPELLSLNGAVQPGTVIKTVLILADTGDETDGSPGVPG